MRRCSWPIVYIAGGLLSCALAVQGQTVRTDSAKVHIIAMLPFGGPAADAAIFLRAADGPGLDYHQFGSSAEFTDVPFGKYLLRLTHLEGSLEKSVEINAPEIWIRQAVPMGLMHFVGGGGSMRGVVSPVLAASPKGPLGEGCSRIRRPEPRGPGRQARSVCYRWTGLGNLRTSDNRWIRVRIRQVDHCKGRERPIHSGRAGAAEVSHSPSGWVHRRPAEYTLSNAPILVVVQHFAFVTAVE
jgi:hypothetical protein